MMGFGFGMGGLGLIWMLLFWGGLILLAIWLVSLLFPAVKKSDPPDNTPVSAVEILKERYARGELTGEEYQQMIETLQH
jgi:putative membrane protein